MVPRYAQNDLIKVPSYQHFLLSHQSRFATDRRRICGPGDDEKCHHTNIFDDVTNLDSLQIADGPAVLAMTRSANHPDICTNSGVTENMVACWRLGATLLILLTMTRIDFEQISDKL